MTPAARAGHSAEMWQGSGDDLLITLTDDGGNPVGDLTGWTAHVQVRYSPDHPDVLAEWSSTGPNLIELADSSARLKVSPEMAVASLAWSWRLAWYDLVLTGPAGSGGIVTRPQRATIRLIPAITRVGA